MLTGIVQAPQDISFQAMRDAAATVDRRSSRPIPAVEHVVAFIGGGGGGGNTGAHVHRAQAARASARRRADAGHRAPARRSSRAIPGASAVPAGRAGPPRRRPRRASAVPVHAAGRRPRRAARRGRRRCWQRCASCPSSRDVNSDQQNRGPPGRRSIIDRDTAARLGITPQRDRRHALRRVRPAAGLDDVHAAQPVPRRDGGRRREFWQQPRRR